MRMDVLRDRRRHLAAGVKEALREETKNATNHRCNVWTTRWRIWNAG